MASIINATTSTGLVSSADNSGSLQLATNNGTTAVTIDTSQNMGIGTTSPNTKLHVQGSGNTYLRVKDTLANGYNAATLYENTDRQFRVGTLGTVGGFTNGAFIIYDETAGAWRMVIDSSGNVGIGTTTPASYGALAVRKGINGTWIGASGNCSFQTSDATNSSLYVVHSSANSGTTFIGTDAAGRLQMFCSATASGGVYLSNGGTSWTSASDERVKENLEPIQNGLAKVASLRAVIGNYINDETKKPKAFLIAQDVKAVLPEAVDSSNPDELGLAYTDVIPLLVASIKELNAKVEAQAVRIAELEGAK